MKTIKELINEEVASLQKDIDNRSYYAKSLWDATPEELRKRAINTVLGHYHLQGLEGNKLHLSGSNRQPMYLAKITGTDETYGLNREFIANPNRGRDGYTFTLEPDTYYAWKQNRVEYCGYFDGQEMAIMTKEEMIAVFEEEKEDAAVKIEEVKEVTIDFKKIVNLLNELTQKEIADQTGISQPAISKYKRGETALTKMTVENAMKLVELHNQVHKKAKMNEESKGVSQ